MINKLTPKKALEKAFLKVKPIRSEIDDFKKYLIKLLDRTNDTETEEFHKNLVVDFLKNTYYKSNYYINTKEWYDLVIHNGDTVKSSVGVIFEVKRPTNKGEMLRPLADADNHEQRIAKLNVKAFQELVLYYLRERITNENKDIKHLIITNINEWFIFDATIFYRLFAQNKELVDQFNEFEGKRLEGVKTDYFYKKIAEPFIAAIKSEIEYTYFDLQDYQKPLRNKNNKDDNKLIALFKILSPEHLLKLPFVNDSNTLDKRFYTELLHIIGLNETKESSKKLIGRNKEGERNSGSILEDAIIQLDSSDKISRLESPSKYGNTNEERLFNVALELSITWMNRIMFLKLLEAQLLTYHKEDASYAFLNLNKVKSYDDLNSLFFQVLAKKNNERNPDVKQLFEKVPYLNSSLFEPSDIEHETLLISNLKDDKKIPIISTTVLKNQHGKKRTGSLPTLEYLFKFLDAYDFSSEGSEKIQEENKTLINASVLGLIFEKINGYKDGSFFTPGFITMYMCRETIRKAVLQKFNETKGWTCTNFDELYNKIDNQNEANEIINSIKVCDPAVGSGHFLVSALNEIIAVKNDLNVLQDRRGRRLKEYQIKVENDELIVNDEDGDFFEYRPHLEDSRRVQEALFHEKQTIIENCLFGVDINQNSVKICRLRLWIELLKNAYYKNDTELETLPNIDINIKRGNSLVSRFDLNADLKEVLRKSKWTIDRYQMAVDSYRNAENKAHKKEMKQLINDIKHDFKTNIDTPLKGKLSRARGKKNILLSEINTRKQWGEKISRKISKDLEKTNRTLIKLEAERNSIENNKFFVDAFEWRFEFPEVLNEVGDFVGFDVVIGNPPYFEMSKIKEQGPYFQNAGYDTYSKSTDIYCLFYERGVQLLKDKGILTYITSNSWLRTQYGELLRIFFKSNTNPLQLINIEDIQVFEDATVESNIIEIEKTSWKRNLKAVSLKSDFEINQPLAYYFQSNARVITDLDDSGWTIGNEEETALKSKIENNGVILRNLDYQILRGFTTGFNQAFFITTEKRDQLIAEDIKYDSLIKPALRGKDISKFKYEWNNIWILLIKQGMTKQLNITDIEPEGFFSNTYPHIYKHLKQTGDNVKGKGRGLYSRYDQGDYWWELRPCVYYEEFEKPKIIWGELSDSQKFAYDDTGMYANNTIFFITGQDLKYLLSILNSKVAKWYFNEISTSSGMGTNRWLKYKIELLPIKQPSIEEKNVIENLADKLLSIKNVNADADTSTLEAQIDQLIYQLYNLTEEEIEIIETI